MEQGHRARFDTTAETVSHDEIVTRTQSLEERTEIAEVIAVIGVTKDREDALSRRDASTKGSTIASHGHLHNARPKTPRNGN